MDYTQVVNAFLAQNLQYILLGIAVFILLALGVFININLKLAKLTKRYRRLMQGMDGKNLEEILFTNLDEVRATQKRYDEIHAACDNLEKVTQVCLQKVGVVRFNAFADVGSDLSFAVAFLDSHNNGVIVSSIFGRDESRTYAKPIQEGKSSYFLTEEEKQALAQAMQQK